MGSQAGWGANSGCFRSYVILKAKLICTDLMEDSCESGRLTLGMARGMGKQGGVDTGSHKPWGVGVAGTACLISTPALHPPPMSTMEQKHLTFRPKLFFNPHFRHEATDSPRPPRGIR